VNHLIKGQSFQKKKRRKEIKLQSKIRSKHARYASMLQSRWVVGVHEQQQEQRKEVKELYLLEELEKNIKIQKDSVQTIKPSIPMIGIDKDGNGLEVHPPLQPDGRRGDDEMDQEESSSEVTERGGLGVSGELDDSGEAS
jgi:hypothetical protein